MTFDQYNNKLNDYNTRSINDRYIFELTKCCEYSFFSVFFRAYTLEDVYKHVLMEMPSNMIELYILSNTGEKMVIPRDNNIVLRDYVLSNNTWFKPIYDMPAKVVYRVYFDDGHTHECESV
jgi:hypothetical protein